jgi:hypothetical protein
MNLKVRLYKSKKFIFSEVRNFYWKCLSFFLYPRKDVVVISFYADYDSSRRYEIAANSLAKQLKKWRIPHEFEKVSDQGGYRKNSLYKPRFIYEKALKYKRTVLWIDCDSVLPSPESLQKMALQKTAFSAISPSGSIDEMQGGLLKFAFEPCSLELLKFWKLYCTYASDKNLPELDHDALKSAILPGFDGKEFIGYVRLNSKIAGFKSSKAIDTKIEMTHEEVKTITHEERTELLLLAQRNLEISSIGRIS